MLKNSVKIKRFRSDAREKCQLYQKSISSMPHTTCVCLSLSHPSLYLQMSFTVLVQLPEGSTTGKDILVWHEWAPTHLPVLSPPRVLRFSLGPKSLSQYTLSRTVTQLWTALKQKASLTDNAWITQMEITGSLPPPPSYYSW